MKNFVQPGETVSVAAPYAVASGGGALVGSLFGVATATAANGADVELVTEGMFDLAKATGAGTAFTVGAKAYWDNTNKVVTPVSSGNTLIGVATLAASTSDTTGRVRLGIVA